MDRDINKQRIFSIYHMLLEMSVGNFNYRIPRTVQDDALEGLLVLTNMLAEEMKETIFHAGYINPHYAYSFLISNIFILDSEFIIKSFSPEIPNILRDNYDELIGHSYNDIISDESQILFDGVKEKLSSDPDYATTLQLVYVTPEELLIPSFCFISRLAAREEIIICSVGTSISENINKYEVISQIVSEKPKNVIRLSDVPLIQNVYDYILGHLDNPLPSITELSQLFSINEFKLKNGFKQLFGTSIYQLYNDERLKRAHILIEQSSLPLKEIAYQSGFSNYDNFYKAFKKKFIYTPTDVRRQAL